MTKKYCVISHTHWDREWYLPFENFRMRLVDLVDNLLDILEKDKGYRFHLDAQTIVLEDYLDIRPQNRELLEGYIRSGNILVGPWYVQNDFALTSGEATVRNLLIGTDIAKKFGKSMPTGYAADQFGLIAQLPQILCGFGLDDCVFGRGFDRGESEFYWETEDGSKVLCEHMRFWYNNAQRFSPDPVGALSLARDRGALCAQFCKTGNYLLMNGVDHLEAQEDLTEILDKVRPMLNEDEEIFQDTLPEFMARVKEEAKENGVEFPTYRGEFRDGGANNVLTGTLSSRVHLKKWNSFCQSALETKLEPLCAVDAMYGIAPFPRDYTRYLWKTLIQNHPHDSICGCSVDAVHAHMVDRFVRINENLGDLVSRRSEMLMNHLDRTGLTKEQYLLLCENTTGFGFDSVMTAAVQIPTDEDKGTFTLTSPDGKDVPFTVDSIRYGKSISILSPINLPGGKRVNEYVISFRVELPPMGHKALTVTPVEGKLEVTPNRAKSAYLMENELLRVHIEKNGTVTLTDRKSGRSYSSLFLLEDNEDRGDSYRFAENDGSPIVTSENCRAKVTLVKDNALVRSRKVQFVLKVDRKIGAGEIPVEMTLTLRAGDPMLGVEMKLTNTFKNHRLRLHFPTGMQVEENFAGQPFDCIVRNRVSSQPNDKCHPNTDYVGLQDGKDGFAILHNGLYEYEQLEGGDLALTLLRANGIVSGSLANFDTMDDSWKAPANQMLGEQTYRLAVYPFSGCRLCGAVAQRAKQFLQPPYAVLQGVDPNKFIGGRPFVQGPGMPDLFYRPIPHPEIVVPAEQTYFKLKSSRKNAMVLSAFKGAENGDGSLILRFFNVTSSPVDFTLTFTGKLASAVLARLDETEVGDSVLRGAHTVDLTAKPKEIVTLKVRFKV